MTVGEAVPLGRAPQFRKSERHEFDGALDD